MTAYRQVRASGDVLRPHACDASDRRELRTGHDLGPGFGEDERLLGLRARNRRVPRERLTRLDHVIAAGRGDQLARSVTRQAALVVKTPLVREAGVGIEATAIHKSLGQRAAGPRGFLAQPRKDFVAGAQTA